jgi:hypothetical protein
MAQSSDVKSVSNTFNADDFSNYSTIINKYPNMGNDTSYMYARNTPTGTEQFFHNTNQGKPVSQLQRGNQFINLNPQDVEAYKKKVLGGTGGFAMGGTMPGAVGFTYARVAGSAPANGKYTKKTKASAQNGQEMKFYQEGLDFRPKTISQNGARLNPELFNIDTRAAQDATRNPVLRKMTAAEKKEAIASANAARERDQEKRNQIIAERADKRQTKGDLNTPGTWNTAEKLRMFPNDVGGLGEMYDDYINPGMVVGSMADMLGESIANRDIAGATMALGMSAGLGALGVDPLGTALKYKNVGSKYLKNLQQQGANVQTASIGDLFRGKGMPIREVNDATSATPQFGEYIDGLRDRYASGFEERRLAARTMEQQRTADLAEYEQRRIADMAEYEQRRANEMTAYNQRTSAIRQSNTPRVPYEAPTNDELLRMNEAEANRYYTRPAQPTSTANRQPVDRDAEMARFRARLAESNARDIERQGASRIYEDIFGPSSNQTIGRPANTVNIPADEQQRAIQELRDTYTRASRQVDQGPSLSDLMSSDYQPGSYAPDYLNEDDLVNRSAYDDMVRSSQASVPTGPKFGDENFKIGQGAPGRHRQTDASGNSFEQRVEGYGDVRAGNYKITGPDGGYMEIDTRTNPNDPNGYLRVSNMTFRSEDEKIAAGQMKKIFSHLPPKLDMGYISTSMYSQPLTDAQIARWANNQPGRIELKNIDLSELNTWHKNKYDAIYDERTGEAYGDYLTQIKRQFPRLQKTSKKVSETTGYRLPEPELRYNDQKLTLDQLDSPEWKERFARDPYLAKEIKIFAPKYGVKKNWKNGGNIVDSMGQWSHPGEITTIPSNDITMKGVNYDVLGVSNTGDKKLMKPGKNYKFDGDYVTEYPKGGWLNKYK